MGHRRLLSTLVLGGAIALGAACTASSQGTGTEGKGGEGGAGAGVGTGGVGAGSGNTGGSNGEGGSLFPDGGLTGGGGGSGDDCAEEAKLVYVIGQDNELYSFYPPTLDVKLIGVINCPQNGSFATPFSMAIDRKGTAWILFNDGKIYHVNVKDASCVATGYVAGQGNFTTFGMGFVSDTAGSTSETLYVADYLGKGLAKIDTGALKLTQVGPWDQIGGAAELTGTGDARLFGFFNKTPIIIAEIDKASGKIISQAPQPTVNIGSGWAFAFWGGDFWLFTSPTGQSQIDRYSPKEGSTTTVKTGLGTNIVGAGVSTCAPVAPPK